MIENTEQPPEAPVPEVLNHENIVPEPIAPIENMTIEPRPPVQNMQPVQPVEPPMVQIPPEQQIFFQQQPQPPQPRPLTEVLGPGSFSFLQVRNYDYYDLGTVCAIQNAHIVKPR